MTMRVSIYRNFFESFAVTEQVPRPTASATGDLIVVFQMIEAGLPLPLEPVDPGWETAVLGAGNGKLTIHWGIYGVTIPAQSTWDFTSTNTNNEIRQFLVIAVQGDVDDTISWVHDNVQIPNMGSSQLSPVLPTDFGGRTRIYFNIGLSVTGEMVWAAYAGNDFPASLEYNNGYTGGASQSNTTFGWVHFDDNTAAKTQVAGGRFYTGTGSDLSLIHI